MNIKLTKISSNDENPFRKYPILKTIWSEDLAKIAEEAIDEAFGFLKEFPEGNIGEIFLIEKDKKVIGISGYFPLDETLSHFMLRWHGILPEYQKLGISKDVIDHVSNHIKTIYLNANVLTEFMPVRESYREIKEYFEKIGFEKSGEPEKVDWSKDLWQSYDLKL